MDPEIMRTVSGGEFHSQKAVLNHYCRKRVSGEVYPGIVQKAHYSLEGIVYLGVDRQALSRLDRFEGSQYARCEVLLNTEAGEEINAQAYVITAEHTHELSEDDWSFEQFLKHGKTLFFEHYQGFEELDRMAGN